MNTENSTMKKCLAVFPSASGLFWGLTEAVRGQEE